jgi:hypothetical protein
VHSKGVADVRADLEENRLTSRCGGAEDQCEKKKKKSGKREEGRGAKDEG